jgi:hypothetical protein
MADSTKPEASAVVTREQALACPYGCDALIKQGLDGSWSCPRCCRSATLEIVALKAFGRGRASRDEEVERLRARNAFLEEVVIMERKERLGCTDEEARDLGAYLRSQQRVPTVTDEQLTESLLREVTMLALDVPPSELRTELAKTQRRITAALVGSNR